MVNDPRVAELAAEARQKSVMDDPSGTAVARTYADALLQAAGDDAGDIVAEFRGLHEDVLAPNPEFAGLLASPLVGAADKLGMIDRAVAPSASPTLANFLRVLARHGRLGLLPTILHETELAHEKATGRRRVVVTTAVPLSAEDRAELERKLDAATSFTPVLVAEVDPAILGGLVIRVGDTVYDSSLKARLRQLRGRLKQQSTHALQR